MQVIIVTCEWIQAIYALNYRHDHNIPPAACRPGNLSFERTGERETVDCAEDCAISDWSYSDSTRSNPVCYWYDRRLSFTMGYVVFSFYIEFKNLSPGQVIQFP